MKKSTIIMDLDSTLTIEGDESYINKKPNIEVINTLAEYKNIGFNIVIFTARNMRTYNGDIGKINIHTLPIILEWLDKHNVPYDEVIVGKPWCGHDGFYVDDRAIRPSEFVNMTFDEITEVLAKEKPCS